ncbi:MAG: abortive infection protein [Actinocrinis sp.]
MNWRGVNYDVGIEYGTRHHSRPTFDPDIVRRELHIIATDLHCNAVRISGTDPQRLTVAARYALDAGLDTWLSPQLIDRSPQQTLDYIVRCAEAAEGLRGHRDAVTFVLGCELTLFMNGIIKGRTMIERVRNPATLLKLKLLKTHNKPLNEFLTRATTAVRQVYKGPLTYAALPIEAVDWTLFDIIGLDYYRAKRNRATYGQSLATWSVHDKPVVVTEVGLCPYQGAEDKGPHGFMIVEDAPDGAGGMRLNGDYIRDEAMQARELIEMLRILEAAGADGTFVFTFVTPALPHSTQPRLDLDLGGFGLVTTHTDREGTRYPGLPWDPKPSFQAVADHYAAATRQ